MSSIAPGFSVLPKVTSDGLMLLFEGHAVADECTWVGSQSPQKPVPPLITAVKTF